MESQIAFVLFIGITLAFAGGYLTWKYTDFFLARRDYYVNSKFELLKKKISICLKVAGTILFLTILLASLLVDKNKKHSEKRIRQTINRETVK